MPSGEEIEESSLDKAKTYLDRDKQKFIDSAKDERITNNTMRHQYRILSDAEKASMINIKDLGIFFS